MPLRHLSAPLPLPLTPHSCPCPLTPLCFLSTPLYRALTFFYRTLTLCHVIYSHLTSLIIKTLLDHAVKIVIERGFIRALIRSIYLNITFDHQYEHITKMIIKKYFSPEITRKRGITLLPSFIVKNEISAH